jgi:hypothetical protein
LAADDFGKQIEGLAAPMAIVLGLVTVIVLVVAAMLIVRHEAQLAEAAERALPGPLKLR